jgi:molybdopterin-containing oxidoreductase family membrane subunit
MISMSYRYLPVFPQERELNPIEPPALPAQAPEAETPQEPETPAGGPEPELSPAES